MAYADYNYYVSEYLLGKTPAVPETEYLYWEKQSRAEIDAYTFCRLNGTKTVISTQVKDCTCAIAELLYRAHSVSEQAFQAGGAGPLVSYSNDGESGTYDLSQSIYTEDGKRAEIKRLVYKYLGNTGLLYAGVSGCRRYHHES